MPEAPYGSESLPHLYSYSRRTGRVQLVSRSATGIGDVDGTAAVSRDGRYVAFASRSRLSGAATGNADVYLADRHSGGLALLTGHLDTPTTGDYLSLSMDDAAHWLVFCATDQADPHPKWYVDQLRTGRIVAVDGSPATAALPVADASIAASAPDVIYSGGGDGLTVDPLHATGGPEQATWFVRNVRTGAVREVAAGPDPQRALSCFTRSPPDLPPTLSPEATRVVVVTGRPLASEDNDCEYDLYLARTGVGR